MKRCVVLLLSAVLLLTTVSMVSADSYNDAQLNWGEYACPHTQTETVAAVESTCQTQGHGAYTYCVECKLLLDGSRDLLPIADHTYDNDLDTDCNVCGAVRDVVVRGDVSGDGKVNNRDLGMLQKYLNGADVTIVVAATDLDGNGKINNRDLGLLQKQLNA